MNEEQWVGLFLVAVGVYFFVCSIWFQDFFLYRLKAARAVNWYGEPAAHIMYSILGVGAMIGGVIKLLGYF